MGKSSFSLVWRGQEVSNATRKKIRTAVNRFCSTRLVGMAQMMAPVETGEMKNSIKFKPYKKAIGGHLTGAMPAWFVENGSVHNPNPEPFMHRALDAVKEELLDEMNWVAGRG